MSTFRPWQFFVLAALMAATVGVFLSRGTTPTNVIFISITVGSAALVGIGAYRTLHPLAAPETAEVSEVAGGRTRAAVEREKTLVLRSIKELEFDRAMDKISEQDYHDMVARLRARAVRLIRQLDAGQTGYRDIIERELASRLVRASTSPSPGVPPPRKASADAPQPLAEAGRPPASAAGGEARGEAVLSGCANCGTANEPDARFCKHCGTKLVASLVLALAVLLPALVFAQIDPRQMSGLPRPDGNLPDGTITVRVIRGTFANNVVDQPVELRGNGQTQTAKTDSNGRATFRAPAPGTTVRAHTVVDGEDLQSQEFPAPSSGGVAVMLVASGGAVAPKQPAQPGTVSFGPQSRFVVDLVDEALQIYYLLEIVNPAPYPVTPPAPIVIELPGGAAGAAAIEGSSPQVVVSGRQVRVTPPLAPGTSSVNVAFTMPYSGGNLAISQKLPAAMSDANIVLRKLGDMQVQSPQLATRQEVPFEGRTYVIARGPAIDANGTLAFEISGLPHHSTVPRTVAGTAAVVIIAIGLVAAFRTGDRRTVGARRQRLDSRREKAFAELVKLEEQKRSGRIDAARYQSRRTALVAQLERIYSELDNTGLPAGAGQRRGGDRDPGGGDEGLAA